MSDIDNYINTKVVVLHEATRATIAARAMCEHHIGCVVAVNHKSHIVGLLTDRDLVCGLLAANASPDIPISEIMTENPVMASESSSLENVIQLMKDNGIRRIPVVRITKGDMQKCIGIITLDDLMADQSVNYKDIAEIINSQLIRKRKLRYRHTAAETKSELVMEVFIEDIAYNLKISDVDAEQFIRFVLGCIIARLHFTAALRLTSQLPKILEKELMQRAVGPDHSITDVHMIDGVMKLLHINEIKAKNALISFWRILERGIGAEHLQHVLHQLPKEFRYLMTSEASSTEKYSTAEP